MDDKKLVRCINHKICNNFTEGNSSGCYHHGYHKDIIKGSMIDDVKGCSEEPIYCSIIKAYTICNEN